MEISKKRTQNSVQAAFLDAPKFLYLIFEPFEVQTYHEARKLRDSKHTTKLQ